MVPICRQSTTKPDPVPACDKSTGITRHHGDSQVQSGFAEGHVPQRLFYKEVMVRLPFSESQEASGYMSMYVYIDIYIYIHTYIHTHIENRVLDLDSCGLIPLSTVAFMAAQSLQELSRCVAECPKHLLK